MPFVEIMPPAEIMSTTPKPSSRQRIARRPSVHTGLPSSWNSSLRQCAGAILLFALATVVTQQAALGVVLLGIVRSFALLVFIAGGVMYPYSRIRAAQQARRDASQARAVTGACRDGEDGTVDVACRASSRAVSRVDDRVARR